MIQQPERPTKHDRTPGWSAAIVRDLWIADLLARDAGPAPDGERPEPEEPFLTALMDHRHVDIAALRTPPESTWLWSDLHLSDRTVLEAWKRPFRHTRELDRHLLREWRRAVKLGDTIICLGDVAHPDVWRDRRTMLDIRNCPGQRILILGNHDVNDANALREAGFRDQYAGAVVDTEPPLVLTHYPLRKPPPETVNIHGHLHGGEAPTHRHMNVSVEWTDYRPVRLDHLLEKAPSCTCRKPATSSFSATGSPATASRRESVGLRSLRRVDGAESRRRLLNGAGPSPPAGGAAGGSFVVRTGDDSLPRAPLKAGPGPGQLLSDDPNEQAWPTMQ